MRRRATMIVSNPFTHDSRVLKEASTLVGRGWSVTVVATAEAGLPGAETTSAGVQVVRVPREPAVAAAAKALMRRRAGRNGARADEPIAFAPSADVAGLELHARRTLEAATHLRFWRRAVLAAAGRPADVIVAHDLDALPAGALAARRAGAPLIYDSHELWLEMPPLLPRSSAAHGRWAAMERALARRARLVITVSDGIAEELSRRYGIRRPLVIRNVPDLGGRHPVASGELRARLGLDSRTPLVLYLGALHGGRGLDELVAAAVHVDEAAFALVGPADAAYAATLEGAARDHGVAGRVHLLPAVPSGQVAALAADADVGVVPYRNLSLNHYLALPTKLFEYLGAGVPVVSGDFPELRSVVRGRDVGVTCDTDDPAAVAAAIRQVLERRDELRVNVRRASDELNWEHEGRRFADAVEALAPLS